MRALSAAPPSPQAALRAWIAAHPAEFGLERAEADFPAWQARLRERLLVLLGGRSEPRRPELETGRPQPRDGYVLRRLTFCAEAGPARLSAWLLTPDPGRRRAGALLALHDEGRDELAGEPWPERGGAEAFGAALARRGQLVLAPDACSGGEQGAALAALLLGRPVAGQHLRDDLAALSLLRALAGSARLGVLGCGEGGRRALLLAALDERVAVAAVSGYFTRLRDEIAAGDRLAAWDPASALPGLAALADLPEVAACCAPRALCIDWGRADGRYTPAAVEAGAAALAAAYAAQGASARLLLHAHAGGAAFGGVEVLDWLQEQLARR